MSVVGSNGNFQTTAGAGVLWKKGPGIQASITRVPGTEGFTEQGRTLTLHPPPNPSTAPDTVRG